MSANLSKSTTFKRIKSKIDSDGMSVWEIESDVCHNRHRKQPFDKKYLSLALRSFDDVFQQEGYDQFQLEDRLENASLNLHLRVELIDRMQHHLKQQTSQAVQKLFNSQQQSDDQPQSKRRKIKSLQSVQSVVDDDQIESIDEDLNSIQFSMDILDNQIFLVDEKEISISSDLLIQQTTDQEIDLFRSATHQNFSSSLFSFLKIIESNFENLQTDQMDETKPIDLIPFLQLIQTPSNQTIQIENFMISHIIGSINDLNIEKSSESSQTITQTTSKDIQPDQHEFHLSADEILQIDNQQVEENMQIDSEEIQSVIEPQTIIDQTKSTKSKTKSKISKKDQTLDSIQYTDFIVLEFKSIPKTKITKQKKPFSLKTNLDQNLLPKSIQRCALTFSKITDHFEETHFDWLPVSVATSWNEYGSDLFEAFLLRSIDDMKSTITEYHLQLQQSQSADSQLLQTLDTDNFVTFNQPSDSFSEIDQTETLAVDMQIDQSVFSDSLSLIDSRNIIQYHTLDESKQISMKEIVKMIASQFGPDCYSLSQFQRLNQNVNRTRLFAALVSFVHQRNLLNQSVGIDWSLVYQYDSGGELVLIETDQKEIEISMITRD